MSLRVAIRRHRAVYRAPRDHAEPDRLRHLLDGVLRRRVPESCGRMLESKMDARDPSLWFIRRLDAVLFVDVAAGDETAIGKVWGASLAAAIRRAIERGPDGEDVRCFRSRAAWTAEFLVEALRGSPPEQWYFRDFEPLRALPLPALLGEGLVRDAEHCEEILAELQQRGYLIEFLRRTPARYAHAALEAVAPRRVLPRVDDSDVDFGAIAAFIFERSEWLDLNGADCSRDVLHLLIRARQATPSADPVRLRAVIERALPRLRAEHLAPAGPSPEAPGIAVRSPELPAARERFEEFTSPYAGVFLLAPLLLDAGLESSLYAPAVDFDVAAAVRHIVLAKCVGAFEQSSMLADRAILLAAGLDQWPDWDIFRNWSRALPKSAHREALRLMRGRCPRGWARLAKTGRSDLLPAAFDRTLSAAAGIVAAAFARRLLGMGRSSHSYLRRNFLDGNGRIAAGPSRIVVELPQAPLRLLLRMAGFDGHCYSLPWLPGREIELRLPHD